MAQAGLRRFRRDCAGQEAHGRRPPVAASFACSQANRDRTAGACPPLPSASRPFLYRLFTCDQPRQLTGLLGQQLQEIIERHDADQPTIAIDDRQAADALAPHLLHGFEYALVVGGGEEPLAHDVANGQHFGVQPHGDDPDEDIAVMRRTGQGAPPAALAPDRARYKLARVVAAAVRAPVRSAFWSRQHRPDHG